MGGLESEVSQGTRTILLEGAAWNFINIRKTARAQMLPSEASYRFSRGVHPAMAERGVRRGLELMQAWAGGEVTPGLVDNYALPQPEPVIYITADDVKRWLGIDIPTEEIVRMLTALEFRCSLDTLNVGLGLANLSQLIKVIPPDHRLDIGEGVSGKADVIEEIARVYGYDNIPETRMADRLPLQIGNKVLDNEERVRDLLVAHGLTEIISYRWTTPEREARRLAPAAPPDDHPYLKIANPLAYEKGFLRHSVLSSVLDTAERNSRSRERLALFEIGPQFLASEEPGLPDEQHRIGILLAGTRSLPGWQPFEGLRIPDVRYESAQHPNFHPGKCARVLSGEKQLAVFGEVHPEVRARYDWPAAFRSPILAADIDLDLLIALTPDLRQTAPVPTLPPVLEDLAVVVDEAIPAEQVAELIRQTGGRIVSGVRLFDVYRGEKVGAGKKSLAYSITYQAIDKTLADKDVAGFRARILRRLEQEVGAVLRS
jgi:phenylalanyl-tRNA synthetase beta chain